MPSPPLNIPRCPRREEIVSGTRQVLVAGQGAKADVLVVAAPGGFVVVKDYGARSFWVKALGRLQIRREAAAYAWLRGVSGVPRYAGRIDAYALAVEWIDGEQLAFANLDPERGAKALTQLREILDAIHARGVVHNDLRGRENVMLRRDGKLAVIDLAAAVRLRPGGLAHKLFFRLFALTDEAAFLKWKGMIVPGSYTSEDEAFLRRFETWRMLWPFNPKRRKAKSGTA